MHRDDVSDELERQHPAAWGWALACCDRDRYEAEDVLQTAYLRVLDGTARFDGRAAFRTFLFGVVHRTALERRRRFIVRRLLLDRWGDAVPRPVPLDPEHEHLQADQAERLAGALGELPGRQREVLHLVFYQGCTLAEAAEVMGARLGTVRTHYERGKTALRKRLIPEGLA
jgi:RNA polymerase sigma-70 factor (ECF subfamily)